MGKKDRLLFGCAALVYEGLRKLLHVAQTVEMVAKKLQVDISPDLAEMIRGLDRLTDEMLEGGRRLWNRSREMTPEEYAAYINKSRDAESPRHPLQERLKLLEELWEDPLVEPEERAELMEKALEAVRGRRKPGGAPCPHEKLVQRHLEALARRLDTLERAGEAAWQRRAAQSLEATCRVWREDSDLPPLSPEEFAAGLRVSSLTVRTTRDEADAIHISMHITFEDEHDSFAGHWITASIEDDALVSVDLEG